MMKKVINLKNLLFLVVLFTYVFASCSKDNDDSSPITLSGVTTIKDMKTLITSASLGDFIAIHGTGLSVYNIDSVLVNDVKADLQEVYMVDSILYMKIPVKLPVKETDKIYIFSKNGHQEIPLKCVPPDLYLERMFNEYTHPGDTIMIYGDYFNLYEINSKNGVVDFNGKTSPVIASGDKYLTARVPLDVDKDIKVKVKSLKYGAEATCPGRYYDNECMIMDFDVRKPSSMANVATDTSDKNRLSGNYLHINDKSAYSGWWYIAEIGNCPFTDDMLDHSDQYVIKCEFKTSNQFIKDKIRFCNYLYWAADPMYWVATDFTVQNFNRWETITLPFVRNISTTYPENYRYHSFNMRLEIDPTIARDFAFDNIRVCKKGD